MLQLKYEVKVTEMTYTAINNILHIIFSVFKKVIALENLQLFLTNKA